MTIETNEHSTDVASGIPTTLGQIEELLGETMVQVRDLHDEIPRRGKAIETVEGILSLVKALSTNIELIVKNGTDVKEAAQQQADSIKEMTVFMSDFTKALSSLFLEKDFLAGRLTTQDRALEAASDRASHSIPVETVKQIVSTANRNSTMLTLLMAVVVVGLMLYYTGQQATVNAKNTAGEISAAIGKKQDEIKKSIEDKIDKNTNSIIDHDEPGGGVKK